MANYNRIKASKAVPIGTIIPWTGSSSTSPILDQAIPRGYLVCRGQTLRAIDYPLLAQLLGNTYGPYPEPGGQDIGILNNYPNYDENDVFNLPNLNQVSLVDIEGSRINPADQLVIGQYISENGATSSPPNLVTSYVDVNFQVESDAQLSGKITGVTLEDPAFFETYRVIPRKLGIDHTPAHTHPRPTDGSYPSAQPSGTYVAFFIPGTYDTQSNKWTTADAVDIQDDTLPADRFQPGTAQLTWYDAANNSLPTMDTFLDFGAESALLPASRTGTRNISVYGQTEVAYDDDYSCVPTQQVGAWSGPFPVQGPYNGRLNFYPSADVAANRRQGPYPVTLNHNTDAWNSTSLLSHNHFTIDLSMTRGQMRVPGTILINNMTTGTISPVSVDKALSVQINPNTPSLTTLIVIRAL